MFGFIKKAFAVAKVDGITFYREKALKNYLKEKELAKSREGKHMYTFEIPFYQHGVASEAKILLEKNGCFDYTVVNDYGDVTIRYWSPHLILNWK